MGLFISNCSVSMMELPLDNSIYQEYQGWLDSKQQSFGNKRKMEFLAGRICAKEALAKINFNVNCLAKKGDGSADFPEGISGSISHNKNYALAVVSSTFKSIGVDVEKIIHSKRLDSLMTSFIFDTENELLKIDRELNGTLIFCAKESLYKAIRPLCGKFFGFEQARVLSISENSFKIKLESNKEYLRNFNGVYHGGYQLIDSNLVTWVLIDN